MGLKGVVIVLLACLSGLGLGVWGERAGLVGTGQAWTAICHGNVLLLGGCGLLQIANVCLQHRFVAPYISHTNTINLFGSHFNYMGFNHHVYTYYAELCIVCIYYYM